MFMSTGMPTSPNLYADEFVDTLKKKAASGTYKELVMDSSFIFVIHTNLLMSVFLL